MTGVQTCALPICFAFEDVHRVLRAGGGEDFVSGRDEEVAGEFEHEGEVIDEDAFIIRVYPTSLLPTTPAGKLAWMFAGGALIVEVAYQPPYWVHALIWGPAILILSLGLLRPLKAGLIVLQYKHRAEEGRLEKK